MRGRQGKERNKEPARRWSSRGHQDGDTERSRGAGEESPISYVPSDVKPAVIDVPAAHPRIRVYVGLEGLGMTMKNVSY